MRVIDDFLFPDQSLVHKVAGFKPHSGGAGANFKHSTAFRIIDSGRQKPQLMTRDLFCYTRMYRDSRCFVALNQGERILLEQVTTDLADGTYTCLLTRRQFQVEQGCIHNLELGSKEGIVLSYIGQHVESMVVVKAQINNIATEPGETVVVIGDCPELGEWDLNKAYPLEYINANTWFGEIPFDASAGKLISFKYAIVSQGKAPRYENTTARRWVLPEHGSVSQMARCLEIASDMNERSCFP